MGSGSVPRSYGRITWLEVSGSGYEQGFQHGSALKERVPKGALPFLGRYVGHIVSNSGFPFLRGPATAFLDWTVARKLAKRIPGHYLDYMRGLSESTGIPYASIERAYTTPETFLYMVATWQKAMRAPLIGTRPLLAGPAMGCTSLVAAKSATGNGTLFHARNFDYPSVGYWDADPVMLLTRPETGIPYLSATSAGVAPGITGMNEAGISIAVHQHWIRDLDLNGIPVGIGAEMVLRHATSIPEAIGILREHPPVSGWTYVIADGKTGDAAAFETTPDGDGIVRLGEGSAAGTLAYTNKFLSPELRGKELPAIPLYWEGCEARLRIARAQLEKKHGSHDAETLASILGHTRDPDKGEHRFLGNCVPMAVTVASVVFEPSAHRVWMSEGRVPSSHSRFLPFNFEGPEIEKPGAAAFEVAGFDGDRWRQRAYGRYLSAYRKQLEELDSEGALAELREATRLVPLQPDLWHLRGLLELKLGRPDDALRSFANARNGLHEAVRSAEVSLATAYALDLLGNRAEAVRSYTELCGEDTAAHVRRAAKRHRAFFPFTRWQARHLSVDFIFGTIAM